jgi:Mlc titration factor MtfA (ptsG expression regulator)
MKYVLLLSLPIAAILYYSLKSFARKARHRSLLHKPFPDDWCDILKKNLPPYSLLTDELRKKLHWYIHVFLDEKTFEGCGGLELNDEIKVTIAGNACLLLLGHPNRLYPTLRTILVYPHTYVAGGKGILGGQIDEPSARLGGSWQNGPIVLAWDSVKQGAVNFEDGNNVTIHEFAHQLDQEDGAADGAPILDRSSSSYRTWAKVFTREYQGLRKKKRKFKKSVMNKYGATNPAEFFAVATESFYEKPEQMAKRHPELFNELKRYYGVNPEEWAE